MATLGRKTLSMSNNGFPEIFVQAVNEARLTQVVKPVMPEVSLEEIERRQKIAEFISGVNAAVIALGPLAESSNVSRDVVLKTEVTRTRLFRPAITDRIVVYEGWGIASRIVSRDTGDSGGKMQSEGHSNIKGLTFDKRGTIFEYHNVANYSGNKVRHTISKTPIKLVSEQSIPKWLSGEHQNGTFVSSAEVLFRNLVNFAAYNKLDIS